MRILFITSRNVYGTSGELRLIKNRTETLLNCYDTKTDFLLFKHEKVLTTKRELFNSSSFDGYYYNWYNHYFKYKAFLRQISNKLSENQYEAVVLSGGFLFTDLIKYVRKKSSKQTKIIIDIHGAIDELIEFPGRTIYHKIVRWLYYQVCKYAEKKAFAKADGFFVVSNSLKTYVLNRSKDVKDKEFFVVPCGLKNTFINSDESQKDRKKYRAKYGISEDELLFIYSGGVSPWQCIDESISLFEEFRKKSSKKCTLLILSGNIKCIEKYRSDCTIVDSYSADEVKRVLCAGDFAFLLRGDYVTNHVAYPNKFLEYVSSGMKIIATENVDDVAKQVRDYSVGIIIKDDSLIDIIDDSVSLNYLSDIKERNALLLATSFETTLKPFISYLKS